MITKGIFKNETLFPKLMIDSMEARFYSIPTCKAETGGISGESQMCSKKRSPKVGFRGEVRGGKCVGVLRTLILKQNYN